MSFGSHTRRFEYAGDVQGPTSAEEEATVPIYTTDGTWQK